MKIGTVFIALVGALLFTALPGTAQEGTTTGNAAQAYGEVAPFKPKAFAVEPSWGTAPISIKQVHAFTCMPLLSSTSYSWVAQGGVQRYCTGGGFCCFECDVDIPTGANIVYMEIDGCDSSATGYIRADIARDLYGSGSLSIFTGPNSGTSESDGCGGWGMNIDPPWTVQNNLYSYFIEVCLSEGTTETTFSAIRIGYQLQISPAPAFATFSDVPEESFWHQYVEALAASGITTGYGDGTFRPDNTVTRGQMAAFLSRALGLHWPY